MTHSSNLEELNNSSSQTPPTLKRLDEIQASADLATKGPWVTFDEEGEAHNSPPATGAFLINYGADHDQQQRDANFMAKSRHEVPLLLGALKAAMATAAVWDQRYPGIARDVEDTIREALG